MPPLVMWHVGVWNVARPYVETHIGLGRIYILFTCTHAPCVSLQAHGLTSNIHPRPLRDGPAGDERVISVERLQLRVRRLARRALTSKATLLMSLGTRITDVVFIL